MNKDLKHNYPLYEVKEFTDFKDMIWQHAEREPNKVAFRYTVNKEDRQVTYKQHYENMNAMGTALADAGYHGIHIAMVGENCYEWALMQITVLASDNVYVPIDKELPMTDLLNVINHSDSKVVFCTGSFAKSLAENRDKIPNVDKIFVFRAKEELPEGLYSAEEFMENGRELGSLAKTARKADMKAKLYEAVNRDIEFDGKRKTYKQYADEFGLSEKTIKRYMSEFEEDI